MTWIDITVNDWDTFNKHASRFAVGMPGMAYAFRGQASSSWNLDTSLVRTLHKTVTIPKAIEIERRALLEFQSQAHLHLPTSLLPDRDDLGTWWSLMQHYGAPTRLLDWTGSIFVAAYFAVEKMEDEDGAIWYVHLRTMAERVGGTVFFDDFEHGIDDQESYFWDLPSPDEIWYTSLRTRSERMIAQQGIFTLSRHALANHGDVIEEGMSSGHLVDDSLFGRLIIPKEQKSEILMRLRTANITASSLFPGADGLGRSISELVRSIR